MSPRPLGYATVAVLQAVSDDFGYGFDIIDRTGLASGTVYPALSSLDRKGLVKSRWESDEIAREGGRPRRRYYRLTREGHAALTEAFERLEHLSLTPPVSPTPEPVEG